MKNNIYNFYKAHYTLKKLNLKISEENICFLVYDDDFNYYFEGNRILEFDDKYESIISFVKDKHNLLNFEIKNFYPICYCENTLVIAIRGASFKNSKLNKYNYLELGNNCINLINFHKENFNTNFVFNNIDKEINVSQKYINRYKFHQKIIKKYILTEEKRRKNEFYNMLDDIIPSKNSIIDISCGDSTDIFQIAQKKLFTEIVGNDICINYLNIDDSKIIFTNDNAVFNNIKENSYDVVICKNTLHHMNDIISIKNLLNNMKTIAKTVIIIEIFDPKKDKLLPKLLNKYLYTKFLKDVGKCYLDKEQFNSTINNCFKGYNIKYNEFQNILGTYMIAKIECEDY